MGKIKKRSAGRLFVGLIFRHPAAAAEAKILLESRFAKTDYESPVLKFNYTDYYLQEFGAGLKRQFLSFPGQINPLDLAEIKSFTNKLEKKLSKNGKRRVNIDPAYLDLARIILATTKDCSHRIYLKKGIYVELTLTYRDKSFVPCDWTYPDYRSLEYAGIFAAIRKLYACSLHT